MHFQLKLDFHWTTKRQETLTSKKGVRNIILYMTRLIRFGL